MPLMSIEYCNSFRYLFILGTQVSNSLFIGRISCPSIVGTDGLRGQRRHHQQRFCQASPERPCNQESTPIWLQAARRSARSKRAGILRRSIWSCSTGWNGDVVNHKPSFAATCSRLHGAILVPPGGPIFLQTLLNCLSQHQCWGRSQSPGFSIFLDMIGLNLPRKP